MTEKRFLSDFLSKFLRLALLASLLSGFVLPAGAADADESAAVSPVAVTKTMRCSVCGMYPARYPKWMAQGNR
ncbi:MAG: hypothetical protein KBD60_11065 [Sterolibacterium sp.]|nr:hypothetical protein [Sterolibacterium sp.]